MGIQIPRDQLQQRGILIPATLSQLTSDFAKRVGGKSNTASNVEHGAFGESIYDLRAVMTRSILHATVEIRGITLIRLQSQ